MLVLILTTTAYAPLALLSGWLQEVARYNPVTQVVEAARQGFVGDVTWDGTWPGLLALAGLAALLDRAGAARDAAHRAIDADRRSRRARRSGSSRPAGRRASATASPYAYTRPSPGRYPWQWYWDSCFAAIVWRRFDADRGRGRSSRRCSRARPRGRVHRPHDLLGPAGLAAGAARSTTSAAARRRVTETIQPPLLAWAWRIAVGDPAVEPRIARPPRLAGRQPRPRRRRAAVDRAARRVGARLVAQVRPGMGLARARAARLSTRWCDTTGGCDWDARRVLDAGGPVLCEVVVNVLWCLSRLAARASPRSRRRSSSGSTTRDGGCSSTRRAPAARARRSRRGRRWRRWRCPTCPRRSAGAWSRSICSTRSRFWLPVPPPSVAATEPSFEPGAQRWPVAPLLARADVGQRGLDAVAGTRAAGLRGRGAAMARAPARHRAARGPARVLQPPHGARASARATSPGRPCWSR